MSASAEGCVVGLTGAGGFVGGAIRKALLDRGYAVRELPSGDLQPIQDAPRADFRRALEGLHHLVHAGARNNADKRLGDAAYHQPNVALSSKLAEAAAETLPGRTIFLSSIRAVAAPNWSGEITDDMMPAPGCAYGRSKREAELACLDAFSATPERLGILRLAPVYGAGMKGNLVALLRVADTPYPLPLDGLPARRSLLKLEAAAAAALHLLEVPRISAPTMIASDLLPATFAEVAAAFRAGLGRPRRIVRFPSGLAEAAAILAGRIETWQALTATQICHPDGLVASGWTASSESLSGLEAVARQRAAP